MWRKSSTVGSTLSGGAGDDTITGGAAADTVTGGAGTDTFAFGALTDWTAEALKTAKEIGVTIHPEVLMWADRVIK